MNRGKFIVVEGGEGVGKSTNLNFIFEYLAQRDIEFIQTREPGGTPFAEQIRDLLLAKRDEPVDAMAELLLMFAARAQHVQQLIKPALERGCWVVSDRFVDASYVYQGLARGLGEEVVQTLEDLVLKEFCADLVIVLDADLQISQARTQQRGELDRFELESSGFHQQVRETYLMRAKRDPQRYRVIDAAQNLTQVKADLLDVIARYIEQNSML